MLGMLMRAGETFERLKERKKQTRTVSYRYALMPCLKIEDGFYCILLFFLSPSDNVFVGTEIQMRPFVLGNKVCFLDDRGISALEPGLNLSLHLSCSPWLFVWPHELQCVRSLG